MVAGGELTPLDSTRGEPDRRTLIALLGVLALAALLRLLWLSKESLWTDEFVTWWCVSGGWNRALAGEITNPPLYYLLVYPWTKLAGYSEAALRFMSVLPSVAAVAMTWVLGRRLFTPRIALWAAAYQAISAFHIFYAQEARAHAWLLLFSMVTIWALERALESPGRIVRWVIYAVMVCVSLYTHFVSVFFLAAQGLYVLLRWRERIVDWRTVLRYATAAGAGLAAFTPWLLQMLETASRGGQVRRHLLLKLPQAYFSMLFGDTLIPLDERAVRNIVGTLQENAPALVMAIAACVTIVPFCLRAIFKHGRRSEPAVIMASIPVVTSWLVSFAVPMFDERYMLSASPFVYLIFAAGLVRATESPPGWARWAGVTAGGLLVILAAVSLYRYYFDPRMGKEEWREAVRYLEDRAAPETDLVIFEPDYTQYSYRYYQREALPHWEIFEPLRQKLTAQDAAISEELNRRRRVWLVRSHFRDDTVLDALGRVLRIEGSRPFLKGKGIEIYEFAARD